MASAATNQDDVIVGINVVPLVDIVLVLLIIFMVTANFMVKPAIDMELPKASTGDSKERNQFSLLLGKDGSIAIGENKIEEAEVSTEFQRLFNEYKNEKRQSLQSNGKDTSDNILTIMARQELTMVIQADTEVSHGRVIHFIDLARQIGILKYAFNVDPAAIATAPAAAKEPAKEKGAGSMSEG